jgi:cell fate regulator YaaT (PSP1 superfamily)
VAEDHPGQREGASPEGGRLPVGAAHARRRRDDLRHAAVRAVCRRHFTSRSFPARFVGVEVDPRRRTARVFFTSDGNVDLRDLCRDLSRDLRMRVILRRLGPRDAARQAGTCGPCGRPLCCQSFLSGFPSISVKLVKEQKFPLTPERSAGICTRLKCCLAYETTGGACRGTSCGGCDSGGTARDTQKEPRPPRH